MNNMNNSVPFFTLNGVKTFARLVDVYDGDTITCIFPIFGENYFKFNIRLNGIDTAEIRNDDSHLKDRAFEARHHILTYLCGNHYQLHPKCSRTDIQDYLKNNEIIVWLECYNFDKYGRILGDIYKEQNENKVSISEILLQSNLAYKYNGGTKQKN